MGIFHQISQASIMAAPSLEKVAGVFDTPLTLLFSQIGLTHLTSAPQTPSVFPETPQPVDWEFQVGEVALLAEVVIFFVVGVLALFQVRILVEAQSTQQAHASWSRNIGSPIHLPANLPPIRNRPISLTGGKTRTLFIALLCVSNFVRAFSLVLMCFWVGRSVPYESHSTVYSTLDADDFSSTDPREWDLYLLQTLPALLFLATYSVVILFWAQVYYATLLVSVPLLRPLFIFLNFVLLLTFGIVAVLTRMLGAFVEFRNYALCFVGGLHIIVAVMFVYFGIQVAAQLAHQGKESPSRNSIIRRVVFLSVVCPLIFALRGGFFLCFVFRVIRTYHPPMFSRLTWDALVFFVTELVPVSLILASFWSSGRDQIQSRSRIPHLDAPLLDSQVLGDLRNSLGPEIDYDDGNSQRSFRIADALYGNGDFQIAHRQWELQQNFPQFNGQQDWGVNPQWDQPKPYFHDYTRNPPTTHDTSTHSSTRNSKDLYTDSRLLKDDRNYPLLSSLSPASGDPRSMDRRLQFDHSKRPLGLPPYTDALQPDLRRNPEWASSPVGDVPRSSSVVSSSSSRAHQWHFNQRQSNRILPDMPHTLADSYPSPSLTSRVTPVSQHDLSSGHQRGHPRSAPSRARQARGTKRDRL